jgi:hypothetical protein
MTASTLGRRAAYVLAALSILVTASALILRVAGPISWTSTTDLQVGTYSIWTTWSRVAICAGISVVLMALSIRLRRVDQRDGEAAATGSGRRSPAS